MYYFQLLICIPNVSHKRPPSEMFILSVVLHIITLQPVESSLLVSINLRIRTRIQVNVRMIRALIMKNKGLNDVTMLLMYNVV